MESFCARHKSIFKKTKKKLIIKKKKKKKDNLVHSHIFY